MAVPLSASFLPWLALGSPLLRVCWQGTVSICVSKNVFHFTFILERYLL